MKLELSVFKKNWGAFLVIFALWCLYLYFTFTQPPSQSSELLHISEFTFRIIQLSIALPYFIIWMLVGYGILQLDTYKRKEEKRVVKQAFNLIISGITALGLGTIIGPLMGAVRTYIRTQESFEVYKALTIATNYIYIFFPLLGFFLLLYGIHRLVGRKTLFTKENILIVGTLLVVIAALYIPLVFTNESRNAPLSEAITATYFLSDVLIIATIIVPLFIAWGAALLAALVLNDVKIFKWTKLSREGMQHFMFGIWFIIISSMLLQGLLSLGGSRLLGLGLGLLLSLIYLFLVLEGIGFLYIASGARSFVRESAVAKTDI